MNHPSDNVQVVGTVTVEYTSDRQCRWRINGEFPLESIISNLELLKAALVAQQLQRIQLAQAQAQANRIVMPNGPLPNLKS